MFPAGSISSTVPFTTYSPITIGSKTGKNKLPVNLLSFTAKYKNEKVNLDWTTSSEINNDYFTVERTLDFDKITDIGKVASYGEGNSTTLQNYSTWDFEPVNGAINYYRLRQTDKDGTTTIASEYVPVRVGLNSVFDIKYVSVSSENSIDVIFDYDSNQPVNYVLYDLTGRMVANGTRSNVDKGIYMLKMDGSKLAHGMYMITLRNKDKVVSKKFVY